jgi:hypothetical protein
MAAVEDMFQLVLRCSLSVITDYIRLLDVVNLSNLVFIYKYTCLSGTFQVIEISHFRGRLFLTIPHLNIY